MNAASESTNLPPSFLRHPSSPGDGAGDHGAGSAARSRSTAVRPSDPRVISRKAVSRFTSDSRIDWSRNPSATSRAASGDGSSQPAASVTSTSPSRTATLSASGLFSTTAGATDDYAAPRSCGALPDSLPGPDVAYRLRLRAGEAVELTVEPEWPFDPALVLARDCTTRETQCLAATDLGGSGEPETLRFQAPSSGDYYVIVDTYRPGGTGRFALSARAVQP